jgi:hypothetical protein
MADQTAHSKSWEQQQEETASTTKRHHNQPDYLSIHPTPHAPLSSTTPKSQESLHTVKGMRKVGQPTPDKNPLPRQETAQMYTPDFRFVHSVSRPDKGNPPIPGKKNSRR